LDPDPPSIKLLIMAVDYSIVTGFVLLFLLLVCSALISGVEVAMFSLTKADIVEERDKKSNRIQIISKLLERPKKLLATILIANVFINISIVILFAYLSGFLFEDLSSPVLKFILKVAIVAFLILVFGEILPKIYASRNKLKFAVFMAYPLSVLDVVLSPLSLPMRSFAMAVHGRLGKQKTNLNVSQLSQALKLTSKDDTTKEEQKILQGIVSFGNTDVRQVMRPRIDIFALNIEQNYAEIMAEIVENGYSRIPVFKDNIDQIVGILYVKDLLPYLDHDDFDWTSLLREPFFVPENKKLDDLMVEFKYKKVHLAVVVDEYGGTSGLISLEDIIEEIVGDISDEFDDEDVTYSKLDENNYIFDGKTALKDFYKILKIEDPSVFENHKGDAETIAGFVLEISGSFPKQGTKVSFKNYVFTIEALDKKRIKLVKLTILND
jgi:putative hemolysin